VPESFEIIGPIHGIEIMPAAMAFVILPFCRNTSAEELAEGEGLRDRAARGW
jgi:hypothetical protein